MNIKHTIEDRIERVGAKIAAKGYKYDREHTRPNAIDYGVTGVLGSIGLASEAAALKLAAKPRTVANVIGQVGLHGLAASATFAAGKMHENAAWSAARK